MLWWRDTDRPPDPDLEPVDEFPALLPAGSRAIRAAIVARISGYTPDWSAGAGGGAAADAGVALVKVFGEQAAPVYEQANRLREKFRREHLRIAGVQGRDPGVGRVTLVLTLLEAAPESVPIAAGAQFTAAPAGGAGEPVVFETERELFATPARPAALVVEAGTAATAYAAAEVGPATPLLMLGAPPRPGNALWLGLSGPLPYPRLAFEIDLGEIVIAAPEEPSLRWDLLTGAGPVTTDVHLDRTAGLRRTGVVEVATRRDWTPLPHPLLPTSTLPPLRWLRVSIRSGRYDEPPRLAAIRLNAVAASGAETIRDEVLEPVDDPGEAGTRRYRLARTPVLPGTVRVLVDAPDPADLFDLGPAQAGGSAPAGGLAQAGTSTPAEGSVPAGGSAPAGGPPVWTEVASLATSRPYDHHFVLDPAAGVLTFGDGVRGAAVPPGFRHVRAVRYRVGGGLATALPAHAGPVPRTTVPNLSAVDNPRPATGAADAEGIPSILARGPALLRSRNRAVTAGDAEVLARSAPAHVARVIALPGAGELTLLVVGSDGSPPVPDARVLDAVTAQLAGGRPLVALGARVAVRPARFTEVEVEVAARLDPDRDQSELVIAIGRAVDAHLDPAHGGEDGHGWPLGVPIGYRRLVAAIAAVPGVLSVSRLVIAVAGRFSAPCRDAPLPAGTLPWPGRHLVIPLTGEENP
ncbi:putative baseplate assembly protein [Actinoplanes sp. NPDC023714]|uniref:putative baseplate assembly protein n=1 Tax=Actinoplanes sp. NPDC023714 TaxID=3154322 RepID=UPI0033EABEB9